LAGRFRLLPRGVEGQYFKAAPDGWLFGPPRPCLTLGDRPTYLVTDAQKAKLAARIRLSRYFRLLLAIPLVAATPLWIYLVRGFSPVANTWLVLGLYLIAVHLLEYLMLRPLLADIPRTEQRMTTADMLRQQSRAMSVRSQVLLCGLFGLASVLSLLCLFLRIPVEQGLLRGIALFSGFLSMLWLALLMIRLRTPSHLGSGHPT